MMPFSFLIALSAVIQAPGADTKPRSRLLEIVNEREKIRTIEFKIRVHFTTSPERTKLEGQDWEIHQWLDSNPGRFRVDRFKSKEHREGSPVTTRYARDEKSYRVVRRAESAAYPLAEFVKVKPVTGPELYDPGIFGLYFEPFGIMHNYVLNDVRRIVTDAVSWKRGELVDGFVETYISKNGLSSRFEYGRDGTPVHVLKTRTTPGRKIRSDVSLEYDRPLRDHFNLPKKLELKHYVNDVLDIQETWELEIVQINKSIDGKLLTWEALAPHPGARLVTDNDNKHINRVWNGSGFEPYVEPPPSANGLVKIAPDLVGEPRPIGFWLFAASTIVLSAVLIYRVKRRYSTRS